MACQGGIITMSFYLEEEVKVDFPFDYQNLAEMDLGKGRLQMLQNRGKTGWGKFLEEV